METIIKNWTVQGYYPNVPLFGFHPRDGITQAAATAEYAVTDVEWLYAVLCRNGLLPQDLMLDTNTWNAEWVANRWWVYRARITVEGEHPRLCFEGVDGAFHVYFNNILLGSHANSYVPFEVDMEAFAGQSGVLMVMVENHKGDLNQSGYTSQITTQRPRYDNKWDFCPRLVSLGIVAPVKMKTGAEITDVKITAATDGRVTVTYAGKYIEEGCRVQLILDGAEAQSEKTADTLTVNIKNPKLWNCNGNGEANLYTARLQIVRDGEVLWEKPYNIGLRTVQFVQNENAPDGCLPYTLVVNDQKTYIKGANMVPIDMSRALFTREKYERIISLAKAMHVNLIRVWGGGVIETEEFYDLCDRNGILVWQDFMQSSSGIDNNATVLEEGLQCIGDTARCAVKRIRNHPSLACYCGGNELMDAHFLPHDYSHKNIGMLKEIVEQLDGSRMFFPTTASGATSGGLLERVGENVHHDIHGPWTFDGNELHYEFYNKMDSLLHSEFGVDGFCNEASIDKMLSKEQQQMSTIGENPVWRHKAEWWDQMPMCDGIFGKCESLKEQLYVSQFLQAEGLRYAIEANRRRAFQNSGSILWQFAEPYANLCCTNIVDYFGNPKPAYYAVQQAYSAVNPNMKYKKLRYESGEAFHGELYLTSEIPGIYHYTVTVQGADAQPLEFTVRAEKAAGSVKAGDIAFPMPQCGCVEITLIAQKDGETYENRILLFAGNPTAGQREQAKAFVRSLASGEKV